MVGGLYSYVGHVLTTLAGLKEPFLAFGQTGDLVTVVARIRLGDDLAHNVGNGVDLDKKLTDVNVAADQCAQCLNIGVQLIDLIVKVCLELCEYLSKHEYSHLLTLSSLSWLTCCGAPYPLTAFWLPGKPAPFKPFVLSIGWLWLEGSAECRGEFIGL